MSVTSCIRVVSECDRAFNLLQRFPKSPLAILNMSKKADALSKHYFEVQEEQCKYPEMDPDGHENRMWGWLDSESALLHETQENIRRFCDTHGIKLFKLPKDTI